MSRARGSRPDRPRALVTGGSGAIGGAVCRALARDGCHVIVHANARRDRADAVVEAVRADGGSAEATAFDLADTENCAVVMGEILESGPLHVLVHNAGIHADAPMAGMDAATWERVIDINLNGFRRVVQPALLPMCRARWGRVIAVSSVAARLGNRGQTNYAAAKAGLHGAVFALAREVANRGVTANVIAPGIIESDMTEGGFDAATVRRLVPAGRMGRPEDVAAPVAFLCGDGGAYINGQVIGVDGGMACG